METLDSQTYLQRMLSAPRPGADNILAFYDHRVGAVCTDPHLVLAPLDDHLCHRGDGVFESIAYRERRLFQLDAHLERMQNSAAGLKITPPCSWDKVREAIIAVAQAGGQDQGGMRVLIGRGPGGFGIAPSECPTASLYITALRWKCPSGAWYEKGLTAFRSAIPAKQEYLARIKNTNYLPNVLMAQEAQERGQDLALSFDNDNCLAEAAIANVGIITEDGTLACPDFRHTLPGTTLLAALDAAKPLLPTRFMNITEEDIFRAREMLLFTSAPLVVGITHFEGRPIADGRTGPLSHQLRELLLQKQLAEGTAF